MRFNIYRLKKMTSPTHARWGLIFSCVFLVNTITLAASTRAPLVVVAKAQTETIIKQVPITGTITSPKVAHLSTEVSGQVEIVKVEVGDQVKTGDVLLILDNEIEAFTLQSIRAETEQARAQLADAKRRYKDAERLKKQNSISANAIRLLQAEVEIDTAVLNRQVAEERKQQARVNRHILKAPFAGVISERLAEEGEWITPGNPVLTLVSIDNLRIDFQVPQEFFPRINANSKITVSLDAIPDRKFNSKIDAVVPISDPTARTFLLRVLIGNDAQNITPGMSVHGLLHLNTEKQGIVVNRDALLRYPDGRVTVWVVTQNEQSSIVSEQLVKVGHSFNGQVSILEGLQPGDIVVVRGNEALQQGQQVRIQASE